MRELKQEMTALIFDGAVALLCSAAFQFDLLLVDLFRADLLHSHFLQA